ncbi:MAG: hypothetical protein HC772_13780 [Leptolyngbyaceae cyanobacterium CRU_2_3]|nr:hypothetical protein [Leptolyngbyaceae cyanobacterium CRU_2_3]
MQAHFNRESQAILQIHPRRVSKAISSNGLLQNIRLQRFSLRHIPPQSARTAIISGISLSRVFRVAMENLRFEQSIHQAIIARETQDVTTQYVVSDNPDPALGLSQ